MTVSFHSNQENYQLFGGGGGETTKNPPQILEALSWE